MDEESIWYMMDEVGCSIRHSDLPNFAVHPLIYTPNGKLDETSITYSVIIHIFNLNYRLHGL